MAFVIPLLAGASFVSSVLGGAQQRRAALAQAQAARIEGQMAAIRGNQIGEQSRAQLAATLGNIDTIRAARGLAESSQTGDVIRRVTMDDAYRAEAIARLGEINRQSASNMAARGYRSAARWAVPMAALDGAISAGRMFAAGRGN